MQPTFFCYHRGSRCGVQRAHRPYERTDIIHGIKGRARIHQSISRQNGDSNQHRLVCIFIQNQRGPCRVESDARSGNASPSFHAVLVGSYTLRPPGIGAGPENYQDMSMWPGFYANSFSRCVIVCYHSRGMWSRLAFRGIIAGS